MRPCGSAALLLLLALTETGARPGPEPGSEECLKLKPVTDKTQLLGRFYFQMGFTDHAFLKKLLDLSSSVWGNLTESETGLDVTQFSKMNGTCLKFFLNLTAHGDRATAELANVTQDLQLFRLTDTSFIMDINVSSPNISTLVNYHHLDQNVYRSQSGDLTLQAHNLYFISKEERSSDAELQRFREHAKCAGFNKEPDFLYKGTGFCSEEESAVPH